MMDWNTMHVIEEKISGTENHFRFTVGNDIIEMVVAYPTGDYFENLYTEVLDHYIRNRNNKPSNPNRTISLQRRIYEHLRWKYLEELERFFKVIASQPASEKLSKQFSCSGHTIYEGSTPQEVFRWFSHHYASTCAAGDFHELVMQVPETDGFLSELIADYLNV